MINFPRLLSPAVIALVLQAGLAAAQMQTNLLTNPAFETGNTTGWQPFGSPTLTAENAQVHSGNFACSVTGRTATYMGISQSMLGLLQAGQTNGVSAWVRLNGGTNETMQLTVQKTDGGTTGYTLIASGTVTSSAWTQLTGTYTYSPTSSVTTLIFYVEVPSNATNSYFIDDVQFNGNVPSNQPPVNGTAAVDWNNVHQRIDGFGASSAWNTSWTSAEADLLFSTNNNVGYKGATYNGVGLSLLRNHIYPAGSTLVTDLSTTTETSIMLLAQARGAKVWSAPWTPPSGFKSTNDIYDTNVATANGINGGSFLGSGNNITNLNYASQLANYVVSMKNIGINLYALSVQNEPDANVTTYEACQWTGAQIHDFVTNLSAALTAKGVSSTKIIAPESEDWSGDTALYTPTLADPNSAAVVSIIANHDYVPDNSVGDQSTPAALSVSGKALWETEVALLSGSDSSIANGVYYAQRIYLYMTRAQANAYHYWWLVASGSGNEGLLDTTAAPTKRLFTFGQYSRFVRPNFFRINATSTQSTALISAYKDSLSTAFAIVAVNTSSDTPVNQTFNMAHFTAGSVTPWVTSSTLSLAPQTALTVTNASFTYTLPPMSVVTFVGRGNTPPTIAPVTSSSVNVGVAMLITNVATDADLPAQTLTFSSVGALPANATLNSNNGVLSWRPLVSQAGTTNLIQIQVTDNGTPNLSATNSLTLTVNPVANPAVNFTGVSGGQVHLAVSGPTGPDYTLLTTTNLSSSWQVLYTTNSPELPVTLTDTNVTDATRFYRLQIGP
jgi:glucuronoarabinoxylan endo-1,4-beta-xylanase